MRFLENLVSDLIRDSTGINARRVVRKVGGKNILLAGAGAALAAVLSQQRQGAAPQPASPGAGTTPTPPLAPPAQTAGVPQPPANLPPLPPLPGAAPSPTSLPATTSPENSQAEEGSADWPPEITFVVVRTMVAAALADGDLAGEEKSLIEKHLAESALDDDKVQQIRRDLVLPPSPDDLADQATTAELRATLYRFAALVILADDNVSDLERGWLDRLARAFALDETTKKELESELFSEDQ